MAAKPMVIFESKDIVACASEEVAIRNIFPHEIKTYDPYEAGGKSMAGIGKRENLAFSDENLTGRTQQLYFNPTEEENYTYYGNVDVDFNKRTSIDCTDLEARDLNQKIKRCDEKGLRYCRNKKPWCKTLRCWYFKQTKHHI